MTKLPMWKECSSFEEAEKVWDEGARLAARTHPIKTLKVLPQMQGVTPETARFLKLKSLLWMVFKDHDKVVLPKFFKHPFKYSWNYLKSICKNESYTRDDDFFLYGIKSVGEFEEKLKEPKSLLVVGFSYCHKPYECPSQRFTADCIHDPEHPVCRQCFIGKAMNAMPKQNAIALAIPTIHYIGGKILEIVQQNPDREVVFLITACEMTLKMFGDWGNMVGIKGIGVRLDGRICNTMKAFELSEQGIKPGLTVVTERTQKRIMDILKTSSVLFR